MVHWCGSDVSGDLRVALDLHSMNEYVMVMSWRLRVMASLMCFIISLLDDVGVCGIGYIL